MPVADMRRKGVHNTPRMPGYSVDSAMREVETINNRKKVEEQRKNSDTENRKELIKMIENYQKNNVSSKDIVTKIMANPIMKNFEYLRKNGVDLNNFVQDLVSRMQVRNKKSFSREEK